MTFLRGSLKKWLSPQCVIYDVSCHDIIKVTCQNLPMFLKFVYDYCLVSFSCVLIIYLLFGTGTSTPGFGAKDQGLWCWTRAAKKNTAHQAVQPHTWAGIVWLLVGFFNVVGKDPPPHTHTHTQLINACTNRLYPLLPLLHCILWLYIVYTVVTLVLGALSLSPLSLSLSLSLTFSLSPPSLSLSLFLPVCPSVCHCLRLWFCLSANFS